MTAFPAPCFCLVTDRRATEPAARTTVAQPRSLERLLDEAIDAGIDLIQIRERDLEAGVLNAFTRRVVARAAGLATRVLVNDRADVALTAGAAGVHLKSDGPSPARVRALGGEAWVVGKSVHSGREASAAVAGNAADYLLFGTVFPSASKGFGAPVAGVDALQHAATDAGAVPVLAIGGITVERAIACRDAGAAGVAAIGLFLPPGRARDALGPAAAVRALRDAWVR